MLDSDIESPIGSRQNANSLTRTLLDDNKVGDEFSGSKCLSKILTIVLCVGVSLMVTALVLVVTKKI